MPDGAGASWSLGRSGDRSHELSPSAAQSAGPGQPGGEVAGKREEDDERTHRKARVARTPVKAVVGEQYSEPGLDHPDQGRGTNGRADPLGQTEGGGRWADEESGGQDGSDSQG